MVVASFHAGHREEQAPLKVKGEAWRPGFLYEVASHLGVAQDSEGRESD
jgi:hypothetical protein